MILVVQYKKVTEIKREDRVKSQFLAYLTSYDGHALKKSVSKANKG